EALLVNLTDLSLSAVAGAYTQGVTPADVTDAIWERIASDSNANAWIHVSSRQGLRAAAAQLDQRRRAGEKLPLFGIPFGVKDNIDVAGMPTTAACPDFSRKPERSARSVELLENSGAICIGKTNLDQFATGLSGTRSPYGPCA